MNNEGLEGSMILEEEIDEDYEPTQEEILEYAKFLGMDTEKEKDLFWIAREGLKAPLPSPWKPCQTKEGEIYYFHFETGESQWEHPCDEYYKKMYEKEKIRKRQEKQAAPKKETKAAASKPAASNPVTSKAAASKPPAKAAVEAYDPLPASKPSKLALKKKETMAYMDSYQDKKANDPLLKAQQEKKMNNYRDEKEQELKAKKDKIDREFEEKRRQVEEDHRKSLDALEKKYQDLKKKEENKIKEEYKPLDERDIPRERTKYTEELQEELEEELQIKLNSHKESLELELNNIKNDYEKKKKEKIKELNEKVGRRYKDTIEDLEVEVSKLRAATLSDDVYRDDSAKLKDSLLKTFIKEQESKFELEKENLRKQISQEIRALKAKEDQKFQEEVNKLYKEFEQDTKDKGAFDEERYKNGLEIDLKTKLEQYKIQVNRKFEIMKLNSLEKLKDYERQKMEAFRNGMGSELEYLEGDLDKEKANLEAQFSRDKLRAEQKVKEDIAAYRDMSTKKLEEKKKLLENEKFEKLNMLKIKLSTLKGVNEHDIKNTEEKLSQMESKMKSFQNTLDAKQEEYRKEANVGDKLSAEIAELENLLNNSSPNHKDASGMDFETRKKVEHLNKVLEQKNQQIEQLKNERSKGDHFISSNTLGTDLYDTNNLAAHPETESFELDKIHLDLEQIKKFVRGQANRDDLDYKDDNYDNDYNFKNQYKNYYEPTGRDKNDLTVELSKDRKTLERKKAQLIRDLQMVNNDKEQYRNDREKQEFLRHVKKLIQKKLTSVNSQLDYLMKLSGKMERSTSVDKGAYRSSYIRHSQNNYVEDSNSEALSEDYEIS